MATQVEIPEVAESVSEVILVEWLKDDGAMVDREEPVCVLETDKADIELPAPASGKLSHGAKVGDTIQVGNSIGTIDEDGKPGASAKPEKKTDDTKAGPKETKTASETKKDEKASAEEKLSPAVQRLVDEHNLEPSEITGTGKGGRLTKEDVVNYLEAQKKDESKNAETKEAEPVKVAGKKEEPKAEKKAPQILKEAADMPPPIRPELLDENLIPKEENDIYRKPMTKIRRKIAERLVRAQQTAALLTTFNEIDMSRLMNLRGMYKEQFEKEHGVGLGMMSFFTKACVQALQKFPSLNAFVDGSDVVYHPYVHMGMAVSTERGLVVPVLRNADKMSYATIEREIRRIAKAAREGKLGVDDLSGATFSITNGGVFGSLLSTPIVNPPQSGILGMHATQDRPVAIDGKIEIRPMMYIALTYDHRIVDGREAVTFLVTIKNMIEDPARQLLDI